MQTFDSINFKLRPMNIYCDCCFIDKLYYKMLIHKLIAFLRKDTFFCLILWILWNPTKYWCENKQVWLWLYIYIYIYIPQIPSLFTSYLILFSSGITISVWNKLCKRAKNGPNWQNILSVVLRVSGARHISFMVHMCKRIISPVW